MAVTLAARLLRSEVSLSDHELHVRIYRNWNYSWTHISQASGQASAAANFGDLTLRFIGDRWQLQSTATATTMSDFTGPGGNLVAVTYRASDGLIVSDQPIANPADRGARVENYCRLEHGGRIASVYDTGAAGSSLDTTAWGELLFMGGYVNWVNLPWSAMLIAPGLDASRFRMMRYITDIPPTHYVAAAELPARQVLDDGRAVCGNPSFAVAAGKKVEAVAIYNNSGSGDIARIMRSNLSVTFSAGAVAGVPVWLDFAGRFALYFGHVNF